jgi:hypothetical protein
MHECLSRGINPESPAAPQSIRDAVAKFFEEGRKHGSVYDGQIKAWDNDASRNRTAVGSGDLLGNENVNLIIKSGKN